jgi:hypothetical protein
MDCFGLGDFEPEAHPEQNKQIAAKMAETTMLKRTGARGM